MKKTWIAILTLALTGAASSLAQAETVTSVNAVGMVRITFIGGEYSQVNIPFEVDTSTTTISDLFGDSLPQNSVVLLWDIQDQTYKQAVRGRSTWLNDAAFAPLDRFDGMFVLASSGVNDVLFAGEVPDSRLEHQKSVTIAPGFNMLGNPFPVQMSLEDLNFEQAAQNDFISVWSNNQWLNISRGRTGWVSNSVDVNSFKLEPGQAFFYFSNRSVNDDWTWAPLPTYSLHN